MRYVIRVWEPKPFQTKDEGFYQAEHAGLLHTTKDLDKALIVEEEHKEWLHTIETHLKENYEELIFLVCPLANIT